MTKDSVALIELNIVLIGLLPRIFFKKDGVFNLKWFATASPFFVCFALVGAAALGYLHPTFSPSPDVLACLLATASIALIFFTLGTHRRPLALWHQTNDAPIEIVTWGAYASIRHPFYTSFLLTLLAVMTALPHPASVAMFLYGLIALSVTARREERRLLQSDLAGEYRDYMSNTGRFVPGLGEIAAMNADVFVDHPTYTLGENVFTVEESHAAGRTVTQVPALLKSGFVRHHVCGPSTTPFDLAKAAVEGIVDELGDIDVIIYATCIPQNANVAPPETYAASRDVKYLMDYPASRLQAHFHLDRAQVIGVNQQACTSMLGSLRLARALLNTEADCDRVLCVTSDRFPQGAIYEQAYNLISDGSAAVVVSRRPSGFRILATHQITNGAMVIASDDETVGSYFSYTHRLITETLMRADLAASEIDWVVPQNTNILAWKVLAGMFELPTDRIWFPTITEAAHVISGDNIVNLRDLQKSGKIRSGERLLMVMAGYGMNWQCTILEAV